MARYIAVRASQGLITLLILCAVVFGLTRLTGNPLDFLLPETATQEDYARVAARLGLDRPLPVQYIIFVKQAMMGDFGSSFMSRRPVAELIARRLVATLQLAGASIALTLLIAPILGVLSAIHRGTWIDVLARSIGFLGPSVPTFWLGLMLIQLVGVQLRLLPAGGYGTVAHIILPAFTIAWFISAGIIRMLRSSMLEVMNSEYVTVARAKGLRERTVVFVHVLRNAMIPTVTYMGLVFVSSLLMGSIVTETVFAWPGLGRLAYDSIMWRDFPVIQTLVLVYGSFFVVANLLIDILYTFLDPRIRYS